MQLQKLVEQLSSHAKYQSFAQVLGHAELTKQRTEDSAFRCRFRDVCETGPLHYLDLGARGGPQDRVRALHDVYDVTLCEPDPEEAAKLRSQGYTVIEKICLDEAGRTQVLNITRKPSNSSIYEPRLDIIRLSHGDTATVEVKNRIELTTTTIDAEENRLSLSFDEIKLDVQGANLPVLQGMRTSRPFIIELEAELLPLYHDQPLFFEVGRHLFNIGYIVCDLQMTRRNGFPSGGRLPGDRRNSRGIPIYGDFMFMPDWSRSEGQTIMERSAKRWAVTLIMNGYEDIVRFVCLQNLIDGSQEILDCLAHAEE